jgi:CRISPR/Cas system endoribonuclease Cas6 (RAMP superfamily)
LLELRPDSANSPDDENSTIAEKTLKALTTMNTKLQKEIFNYLALKIKLAFAKSGIGIGTDKNSNLLTASSAEDFFREIEERVAQREEARGPLSYQNISQANEKVRLGFEHTLNNKTPQSKRASQLGRPQSSKQTSASK